MSAWGRVRETAATDAYVMGIVETTLEEAMRRVREAEPAGSTRLTYDGGRARAVGLMRKMRSEVRAPWTGRKP